ncbi:hypothetical protein BsWGS_27577 [Bradybaena similaris]
MAFLNFAFLLLAFSSVSAEVSGLQKRTGDLLGLEGMYKVLGPILESLPSAIHLIAAMVYKLANTLITIVKNIISGAEDIVVKALEKVMKKVEFTVLMANKALTRVLASLSSVIVLVIGTTAPVLRETASGHVVV